MVMSDEHRLKSALVTSPYEWEILEWDEKLQTNKRYIHFQWIFSYSTRLWYYYNT